MLFRKLNIIILALLTTVTTTTFASGVDDLAITTEVKAKLIKEPDIPKDIEVTTKGGVVNLKGKVDTHLQAHKAIEVASSIDKVVDVIDTELKVKESNRLQAVADGLFEGLKRYFQKNPPMNSYMAWVQAQKNSQV